MINRFYFLLMIILLVLILLGGGYIYVVIFKGTIPVELPKTSYIEFNNLEPTSFAYDSLLKIAYVTDLKGNVLTWMSSGSLGFSGPKKSTPFAATKVGEAIAEKILRSGMKNIEIYVKGLGAGRDAAIRALSNKGLNITL
ncbi:MAG: 30S ribosomal protein S11, partial [bacterium]